MEETQAQIKKQKNLIDQLERENQQLKDELVKYSKCYIQINTGNVMQKTASQAKEFDNIATEINAYKEKIQQEKSKTVDISCLTYLG